MTRDQMSKRGWPGDNTCNFCDQDETVDHLFVKCPTVRRIWFWMGQCQTLFSQWNSVLDIIEYAYYLPLKEKEAFLIVFSALCWVIWNNRNSITFQKKNLITDRNLIILICVQLQYWAGNIPSEVEKHLKRWLPQNMDENPIQAVAPLLQINAG